MSVIDTREFIVYPSELSKVLVDIVTILSKKHSKVFQDTSFFKQVGRDVRINIYLKDGYKDVIGYLNEYRVSDYKNLDSRIVLRFLLNDFSILYDKLLFNNFVLMHRYITNHSLNNAITTKEDEKLFFLQNFAKGLITKKKFDGLFGHYGLNSYELSSRRFREYSERELFKIAKMSLSLKLIKKQSFEEFFKLKQECSISVLNYIRELSKYKILMIIDRMRIEIIKISKEENIRNIFNIRYEELLKSRK